MYLRLYSKKNVCCPFIRKKTEEEKVQDFRATELSLAREVKNPVLRIHDILVLIRIRIWICGSMPLTNVSGSCHFRH
jgi:hypothetical protein